MFADALLALLMPLLADLARQGGYGVHGGERAAFLVLEPNGEVRCVLWPDGRLPRSASYQGPIPPNTIAIAHTHPACCRSLSAHDHRQAARLSIPVIAVSKDSMHVAWPDGTVSPALRIADWRDHEQRATRCGGG